MIENINKETLTEIFGDYPESDEPWIGDMRVGENFELIFFLFENHRFLAGFFSPVLQIGSLQDAEEVLNGWADGFMPADDARLVKFARADADDAHYDPAKWSLRSRHSIFRFGKQLAEVVTDHVISEQAVSQYFYWPADERLNHFYTRVFKGLQSSCPDFDYQPILAPTGEFYGYHRT